MNRKLRFYSASSAISQRLWVISRSCSKIFVGDLETKAFLELATDKDMDLKLIMYLRSTHLFTTKETYPQPKAQRILPSKMFLKRANSPTKRQYTQEAFQASLALDRHPRSTRLRAKFMAPILTILPTNLLLEVPQTTHIAVSSTTLRVW